MVPFWTDTRAASYELVPGPANEWERDGIQLTSLDTFPFRCAAPSALPANESPALVTPAHDFRVTVTCAPFLLTNLGHLCPSVHVVRVMHAIMEPALKSLYSTHPLLVCLHPSCSSCKTNESASHQMEKPYGGQDWSGGHDWPRGGDMSVDWLVAGLGDGQRPGPVASLDIYY